MQLPSWGSSTTAEPTAGHATPLPLHSVHPMRSTSLSLHPRVSSPPSDDGCRPISPRYTVQAAVGRERAQLRVAHTKIQLQRLLNINIDTGPLIGRGLNYPFQQLHINCRRTLILAHVRLPQVRGQIIRVLLKGG